MDLIRCAHIGPCVAVTGITTALAISTGIGARALWAAAAVMAGQLSVGWSNDWLDARRDRAAGRTDKPLARGTLPVATVRRAAFVALAACAALSLACGIRATVVHLLAVGMAWGYNFGLKRTPASVVPYALSFALLPIFVTLASPARSMPGGWAIAAAGFLGAGAHFTNTLPDLDADTRTGIRGLPHRLGPTRSLAATVALLATAGTFVTLGPQGPPPPGTLAIVTTGAALLTAVVIASAKGHPRTAFRLTIGVALAMTTALVTTGTQL